MNQEFEKLCDGMLEARECGMYLSRDGAKIYVDGVGRPAMEAIAAHPDAHQYVFIAVLAFIDNGSDEVLELSGEHCSALFGGAKFVEVAKNARTPEEAIRTIRGCLERVRLGPRRSH